MTTFRILPSGHRRRLPDGSVRALGANGSPYFDVSGSTSLGVDAGGVALPVVPMVGQTWLSFALAGSLTYAGTVGHTTLSIGVAGALSSAVNLRGASLLGVNLLGNLTPAVRLYGSTGMQFVAAGRLLPSVPVRGLADLAVDAIGRLSIAATMRGQLRLGIGVSGTLSVKAAQNWRDLWRDVYDTRQALLNAIDQNNRDLAKQAGNVARATANALILTDTKVEEIGDTVTAQGFRIEQVSASVPGVGGNLVKRADFSDMTATGWINAVVANAPAFGFGAQPSTTYQGPYITTDDNTGTYENNWFTVTPGEVLDIQANAFNTVNTTGKFGLHFRDKNGIDVDRLSITTTEPYEWEPISGQITVPDGAITARVWMSSGIEGNRIWITQPDVRRRGASAAANASALSLLSATVTRQGEDITAQGTALTEVTASASGKNTTYMQSTAPMGTADKPLVVGDLWIDTSSGENRLRRWNGSNWVAAGDSRIGGTASAVQVLDARVTTTEQGVTQAKATWGVYLTAGNLISGVQSINDGTIAEFNVSANVFRVMSPSGAPSGMEWQNGYLRSWKENTQVIMGNGFGASNDLMFYAGPNVGVGNATKANAVFWIDSAGVAYFAGQVLQGVLRFFNSNTTVGATASVETGMNASNGKLVAVQGRFSYDHFQQYQGFNSNITLGGGQTAAVVVLERQYTGQAWVEIARRTMLGVASIVNLNDGPSTIQYSIDGSIMATDAASTTARNYRTRIISISLQEHNVTNPGTTPQPTRNQYQSIESLE